MPWYFLLLTIYFLCTYVNWGAPIRKYNTASMVWEKVTNRVQFVFFLQ